VPALRAGRLLQPGVLVQRKVLLKISLLLFLGLIWGFDYSFIMNLEVDTSPSFSTLRIYIPLLCCFKLMGVVDPLILAL
jgi:hypothetical protein